ncbi:Tll0287-like domain-containing protein [Tenacibaculum piscium]|uniref:Tll0287-like domain-containing protein n=2 Tax=Tenacibaculum piscium TaxID=1458515 RepID=UPI001F36970B|nr:DUF3365 domain-containing protein [Tenacibaculum piscium]
MIKYLKYFTLLTLIIFVNCNGGKQSEKKLKQKAKQEIKQEEVAKISEKENSKTIKEHEGKKLLETKCFVCHNISASHEGRIAPPMIAVKAHYIQENTKKEDFIAEFTSFVTNPTEEKTKMRGAVKKFGVMPKQVFDKKDIEKIANYLFDYKIAEPSWFQKHWKERKGTSYFNEGKTSFIEHKTYEKSKAEIGLSYALGTKKVLGKNLMGTIQKKGTLSALKFCNEKAYKLTDSMALKYNAKIKRVSDKPRNPKNIANAKELEILENYKKIVANKQKITPLLTTENQQTTFYYPIVTNAMCLQCHGKPKTQIAPETLTKLADLYPKDKAVNYDINQVRGIWSITYTN